MGNFLSINDLIDKNTPISVLTKEEGGGCGLGSDLEPWNILWIWQNDEDTLDPQHCFKGTLSLDFYLYIYARNTLLMKRLFYINFFKLCFSSGMDVFIHFPFSSVHLFVL